MTAETAEESGAASTYPKGGGGTVLEHRYGAVLLADLLTGGPVPMLGDDVVPVSVRFQASAVSPVDDLLVLGRMRDGGERRLSIGARRKPRLVTSDRKSAKLLEPYLLVAASQWCALKTGRWRLGLAVASYNPAAQQLGELSAIARGTSSEEEFRKEIGRAGRVASEVRGRLVHLDALAGRVIDEETIDTQTSSGELLWRVLSSLRIHEFRLEGADKTDRTAAVSRLRAIVHDGTAISADGVFARLAELAGQYAPSGSIVAVPMLRRDLSGTPLARSPQLCQAWSILDGLSSRLRDRTACRLVDAERELQLDRVDALRDLASQMAAPTGQPICLVVSGEPDVGKSALALRAAEQLGAGGVSVVALSLRDLPATTDALEALLQATLLDVFAGVATGSGRLLLVDGVEAVLEGRGQLFTELSTAALRAGTSVVAVTRDDGATAVGEALGRAAQAAGLTASLTRHEVPRLTPEEVSQITGAFPSLARLVGDPRAEWLLGRPGLVDLLLRAGKSGDLPARPLSEADVFAVIWQGLVRRGEAADPAGPSPDQRARAMTALARRLLLPNGPTTAPDAEALPSLRSDGLLLSPGLTGAWNDSDQFASDLIRDLTVARLLIEEGWALLDAAGAPRWALRSVRLACQASLANAQDTEQVRLLLDGQFERLAERHGVRWLEVPLEALLTLGTAEEALRRAWPALLANEQAGLKTLLRLALDRYTQHGVGDPHALAPIVHLTFCGEADLGQHSRYSRRGVGQQVRDVTLAWLRGLVSAEEGPVPLRARLRDKLLAQKSERYDEFAVEAFAMLGADFNDAVEMFLRELIDEGGDHLGPAVEPIGAVVSMSRHQAELLIDLAEAYYIEPKSDDPWLGDAFADGIRDHHGNGGFGVPSAAWYYGPFFRLLNSCPKQAISLINRILDHGAAFRDRQLASLGGRDSSAPASSALKLCLPGVGPRDCAGDDQVWRWYRGNAAGPDPCASALLATERFADYLVDVVEMPLDDVVRFLLRTCHNLAMPGLVVGLLIRRAEDAGELLDPWLAQPELWYLDSARAASEGFMHVQGADPPDLVGRDRRRHTLGMAGGELMLRAIASSDQERLTALAAVGDELLRRARGYLSDDDADSEVVTTEGWASTFRPENYHVRRVGDSMILQYEHPEGIASELAASLESLSATNEAWRLQLKYGKSEDRRAPVDTLIEDLAIARSPAQAQTRERVNAVAAVAAAAIVAHVSERASVPEDDLRWCADVLVDGALHPDVDDMNSEGSMWLFAADRSAAAALPHLLLLPPDTLGVGEGQLCEALVCCARSSFDEVRNVLAMGLAPVWAAPCDGDRRGGSCRHELAFAAAQEGLRDCRLADWNAEAQCRPVDPVSGPFEETLPAVPTDRLRMNRLELPLIAAAGAAQGSCCVAAQGRILLDVLLASHRRAWDRYARKGYGRFGERRGRRAARVLVELAAAGDFRPLTDYVRVFSDNARALDELFDGLALVFTYEDSAAPILLPVARAAMTEVLDAIDAGADLMGDSYRSETAVARMILMPRIEASDDDVDATIRRARENWFAPDDIADLIARWMPLGSREPKAVDAIVQLAQCASGSWQAQTGLLWVEQVIDSEYKSVAARCYFLTEWLESVRVAGHLNSVASIRWRRIVDGLAACGDRRAVKLQRAEE